MPFITTVSLPVIFLGNVSALSEFCLACFYFSLRDVFFASGVAGLLLRAVFLLTIAGISR